MSIDKGKLIWALDVLIMKHADRDARVVRLVCVSLVNASADDSEKKYMGCLFLKLQNLVLSKNIRNSDVDAVYDFLMNVRIDIYRSFLVCADQRVAMRLVELLPPDRLLALISR